MKVYFYDENTKEFVAEGNAFKDPRASERLGKDVWLLPANATFDEPLQAKDGYKVVYKDGWVYEKLPQPEPEPEPEPLTVDEQNEIIRRTRESLYRQNTDVLTLEKLRRQALNDWTIADEEQYVAKIKSESEKIVTENAYVKE